MYRARLRFLYSSRGEGNFQLQITLYFERLCNPNSRVDLIEDYKWRFLVWRGFYSIRWSNSNLLPGTKKRSLLGKNIQNITTFFYTNSLFFVTEWCVTITYVTLVKPVTYWCYGSATLLLPKRKNSCSIMNGECLIIKYT